ncbi:hypothetical protein B7R22_18190 [Subtercola boreus]|uniref:SnoaL-like domain-containing protein n=1 Tax=Subtercola boreus TaxID=120213 RepID=A0A3E0VQR2_9MICO|nr:nuclear transport factor 2 family protein [Subtercola boreus]RFA11713.1 hypothetical protein B7R22_18190 [Subtercola boreus]
MYGYIVKRLAARNFNLINTKGYEDLLASCADDIYHRFGGDHALGGERHTKEGLRLWLGRLGRVNSGLQLKIHEMWVKGFPWNTVVIIRWTGTAEFPDGSPYNNHGVHLVHLRWGKVTSIDANEDSQVVAKQLAAAGAAGVAEAALPPILT